MSDETEDKTVAKPRRGRPPLPRDPAIEAALSPKPAEPGEEGFELYASVPKPTMRSMELKRHYRPHLGYELVGYNRPEIKRKGPDGKETTIQEAAFIPDVMAPSPMPGVDVQHKVWATTVIRVPVEEARIMRQNGIADATVED